ncbi:MAG: cyclic peptide export ABC transporter [Oscillatoriales cyanobacterium]|nr:MAG: cyclic peptide export ABC transporter [Oscillatoriales cyanobacterium]
MTLLSFLLQASWPLLALSILAGFVSGGSSAGLLALIGRAIAADPNQVSIGVPYFVILGILAPASAIVSQLALIRLSQTAVLNLRLHLARQILRSDLQRIETLGAPRLLATLTDDVQMISAAISTLPLICIDLAVVVGCFGYIAVLSWQVLLMVVALMVVAMGSCFALIRQGKYWLTRSRNEQDRLYGHFRTIAAGFKELKLHRHRRRAFFDQDLFVSADRFRHQNERGLMYVTVTSSWGKFIFVLAMGFILFSLPQIMTVPTTTLSSYIVIFTYLMLPLEKLVAKLPIFSQANVALEKIDQLGLSVSAARSAEPNPQTPHPPRSPAPSLPPRHAWHSLELRQISHTYRSDSDDRPFTLGPIDLQFTPGEIVFIVGGNGSGKSTLAKLITGLYTPDHGEIAIDQWVITDADREDYRQYFAAIFADFYLFERLLGLDRPDLTPADLDQLAQTYITTLQLDRKVQIQAGQLSTTALSQGQRKRLALLTALLEDRPIYLFDEWAADQDPQFKDLFYREVLPELKRRGKTTIAITHDDRYFDLADRVITLEYGQLV